MAAKRRFWKKTWLEFFQASPDVRLVVMVTYLKTMVSWLPWHDYRDKLENRWKHLFKIFNIGALAVVPRFSAWGFGQIREKTWLEFFQVSPDVILVVMVTYLKTMVSWLPWHDYRDKLENRWKHFLKIFNIGALDVVPRFAAWGFGQIRKKTWPEFFSFGHVTI